MDADEALLLHACTYGKGRTIEQVVGQTHLPLSTRVFVLTRAYTMTDVAIASRNVEGLRYILSMHVDTRNLDFIQHTPMTLAVESEHPAIFDLVSARYPASDRDFQGNNALHVACRRGNETFVRRLLQMEPDLRFVENFDGATPLQIAFENGQTGVAREFELAGYGFASKQEQGVCEDTVLDASSAFNDLSKAYEMIESTT